MNKTTCNYFSCVYHACMSKDCQREVVFDQGYHYGPSICSLGKDLSGDVFLLIKNRNLKLRVHFVKDVENFRYEYYLKKDGYSKEFKIKPLDVIKLVNNKHISKFAYEFL